MRNPWTEAGVGVGSSSSPRAAPFNQKSTGTAGSRGRTATISGQIDGTQALGIFSRSAHLEGTSKCKAVSVTWKATYKPNASPDLP